MYIQHIYRYETRASFVLQIDVAVIRKQKLFLEFQQVYIFDLAYGIIEHR